MTRLRSPREFPSCYRIKGDLTGFYTGNGEKLQNYKLQPNIVRRMTLTTLSRSTQTSPQPAAPPCNCFLESPGQIWHFAPFRQNIQ